MIKVGQIYTDNEDVYVVTNVWTNIFENKEYFSSINTDGDVNFNNLVSYAEENDKLIAEYPTWQEAVNSKEFKVGGK